MARKVEPAPAAVEGMPRTLEDVQRLINEAVGGSPATDAACAQLRQQKKTALAETEKMAEAWADKAQKKIDELTLLHETAKEQKARIAAFAKRRGIPLQEALPRLILLGLEAAEKEEVR